MSKIDALLKELNTPGLTIEGDMNEARQIIKKHFEIVHNEAVTATIISENRKQAHKSSQPPIYKD